MDDITISERKGLSRKITVAMLKIIIDGDASRQEKIDATQILIDLLCL